MEKIVICSKKTWLCIQKIKLWKQNFNVELPSHLPCKIIVPLTGLFNAQQEQAPLAPYLWKSKK